MAQSPTLRRIPIARLRIARIVTLPCGDHADRFPTELLFLKRHQFGDEPNVWRDALAPFEDKGIRTRERPVVRVNEVGHHGSHGARLARFAMDIGTRSEQTGLILKRNTSKCGLGNGAVRL